MAQDRTEDVRSKLQQLQVADNPTQEPVDKNDMGVVVAPVNPRRSQRLIENGIKRHGIPNQREREELARKRMKKLDLHRRVQPSTVRITKVKSK
jgi:isocitrate dehydrogenase